MAHQGPGSSRQQYGNNRTHRNAGCFELCDWGPTGARIQDWLKHSLARRDFIWTRVTTLLVLITTMKRNNSTATAGFMNLMPALVTVQCCSNAVWDTIDLMPTWTRGPDVQLDFCTPSDASDTDRSSNSEPSSDNDSSEYECPQSPESTERESASVGSSVGSCKFDMNSDLADTPCDIIDGDSSILQ